MNGARHPPDPQGGRLDRADQARSGSRTSTTSALSG
jgi:hypothetical protein